MSAPLLNATIAGCTRAPLLSNEGLHGASCGAKAEISELKRLQDISEATGALQVEERCRRDVGRKRGF